MPLCSYDFDLQSANYSKTVLYQTTGIAFCDTQPVDSRDNCNAMMLLCGHHIAQIKYVLARAWH